MLNIEQELNRSIFNNLTDDGNSSVLQIWALEISSSDSIEFKLLYGHVIPYEFNDNIWRASSSKVNEINNNQYRIVRTTLKCNSRKLIAILSSLSHGKSIADTAREEGLITDFKKESHIENFIPFNTTSTIQPSSILFPKERFERNGLQSLHSHASSISAFIHNDSKSNLFTDIPNNVITNIKDYLKSNIGIDISGEDYRRLGAIEITTFPTINSQDIDIALPNFNHKENTISVSITDDIYNNFESLSIKFNLFNDQNIVFSEIVNNAFSEDEKYRIYKSNIPNHISQIVDKFSIEGYSTSLNGLNLVFSFGNSLAREIGFNFSIATPNHRVLPEWLTKDHDLKNLTALSGIKALTRPSTPVSSTINTREVDSWVSTGRELSKAIPKTKDKNKQEKSWFFPKYKNNDSSGRIDFSYWFTKTINSFESSIIYIFDPHFDEAGISLLSLSGNITSKYIIVTTRKEDPNATEETEAEINNTTEKTNRILSCCEANKAHLKSKDITIYSIPFTRLPPFHDRYICVFNMDSTPIKGFHLSNSIQSSNENYPMLVTSIEDEPLTNILQYIDKLIDIDTDINNQNIIFKNDHIERKTYEHLEVLNNKKSGLILSKWLNDPSLIEKEKNDLELLFKSSQNEDSYKRFYNTKYLFDYLSSLKYDDFEVFWPIAGKIFANISTPNCDLTPDTPRQFLDLLETYISDPYVNHIKSESELISYPNLIDDLDEMLNIYRSHEDISRFRFNNIEYPTYFAVLFLWKYRKQKSINFLEENLVEPKGKLTPQMAITTVFIEEICLEISFNPSISTAQLLLSSKINLIKWLGYSHSERLLIKDSNKSLLEKLTSSFDKLSKIKFIGWVANRNTDKTTQNNNDLSTLLETEIINYLLSSSSQVEFESIINSLRIRMKEIGYLEPWLHAKIIDKVLTKDPQKIEFTSKFWENEIINYLTDTLSSKGKSIVSKPEIQTTNVASYYSSLSSELSISKNIKNLTRILNKAARVIREPLSRSFQYSKFDDSLKVSVWIFGYLNWLRFYLEKNEACIPSELITLINKSKELIDKRWSEEWQLHDYENGYGIHTFLIDMEELQKIN